MLPEEWEKWKATTAKGYAGNWGEVTKILMVHVDPCKEYGWNCGIVGIVMSVLELLKHN